jgi:hypothetical protein
VLVMHVLAVLAASVLTAEAMAIVRHLLLGWLGLPEQVTVRCLVAAHQVLVMVPPVMGLVAAQASVLVMGSPAVLLVMVMGLPLVVMVMGLLLVVMVEGLPAAQLLVMGLLHARAAKACLLAVGLLLVGMVTDLLLQVLWMAKEAMVVSLTRVANLLCSVAG